MGGKQSNKIQTKKTKLNWCIRY